MSRQPTFLIFEVVDPAGLVRHAEELNRGTRFAIKRSSSRAHVDRWLAKKRIRQVKPKPGICGVCGCTDYNCFGCIERTGAACSWLDPENTVCSACYGSNAPANLQRRAA
jgi:hypothetical protein